MRAKFTILGLLVLIGCYAQSDQYTTQKNTTSGFDSDLTTGNRRSTTSRNNMVRQNSYMLMMLWNSAIGDTDSISYSKEEFDSLTNTTHSTPVFTYSITVLDIDSIKLQDMSAYVTFIHTNDSILSLISSNTIDSSGIVSVVQNSDFTMLSSDSASLDTIILEIHGICKQHQILLNLIGMI
jgi:hypothetical protein